jgi:hypothetical protein
MLPRELRIVPRLCFLSGRLSRRSTPQLNFPDAKLPFRLFGACCRAHFITGSEGAA